ncbi:MAG: hypothetical protein EAZ68_08205 [Oscillatoriales cyanobacterium]|nr:MAG: hypothetical protein EAZ68_08205 [Oscillatoriales cyanobacterium]
MKNDIFLKLIVCVIEITRYKIGRSLEAFFKLLSSKYLIDGKKNEFELSNSPLVLASFRLARAFGWTPQQVGAMTMAQVSMYLQLLDEENRSEK